MAQVRDNTESTARQYALAEEAVRLGWPGPRWRLSTPTSAFRAALPSTARGSRTWSGGCA